MCQFSMMVLDVGLMLNFSTAIIGYLTICLTTLPLTGQLPLFNLVCAKAAKGSTNPHVHATLSVKHCPI